MNFQNPPKLNNFVYSEPLFSEKITKKAEQIYMYQEKGKYLVEFEVSSKDNQKIKNNFTTINYKKPFKFPYYILAIAVLAVGGYIGL